jgi:dipeptidase E
MRLYLSSERFGNHADKLKGMVRGNRVAIIENTVDFIPFADRQLYQKNVYDIKYAFSQLGFYADYFDLRSYFNEHNKSQIEDDLKKFDLVWVCGGNVFLLRRAMYLSGFDTTICKLIYEDAVCYGGWSAGISVLSPSLKGLEFCDNPFELADGYTDGIIWDGLNVLDSLLIPHHNSSHPENSKIETAIFYSNKNNIPNITLRDGDVLIVNNKGTEILKYEEGSDHTANRNKVSPARENVISRIGRLFSPE